MRFCVCVYEIWLVIGSNWCLLDRKSVHYTCEFFRQDAVLSLILASTKAKSRGQGGMDSRMCVIDRVDLEAWVQACGAWRSPFNIHPIPTAWEDKRPGLTESRYSAADTLFFSWKKPFFKSMITLYCPNSSAKTSIYSVYVSYVYKLPEYDQPHLWSSVLESGVAKVRQEAFTYSGQMLLASDLASLWGIWHDIWYLEPKLLTAW